MGGRDGHSKKETLKLPNGGGSSLRRTRRYWSRRKKGAGAEGGSRRTRKRVGTKACREPMKKTLSKRGAAAAKNPKKLAGGKGLPRTGCGSREGGGQQKERIVVRKRFFQQNCLRTTDQSQGVGYHKGER